MLHRLFDKGWKIAVEGVGLLTGAIALWVLLSVEPTIHPPGLVDPTDPLRAPFVVANDGDFFTLYTVHPWCNFDDKHDFFIKGLGLSRMSEVGDLSPRHQVPFTCAVTGTPSIAGLTIHVTVDYAIHPFFFVYWHHTKEARFSLMISSKGDPFWVEGVPLGSS